ncbi:MAG: hypothetical protein OEZ10_10365 [Gammaproteobacteria bacterium]|nr:hypothetical protein [Gammaproteobacteria bacterium]
MKATAETSATSPNAGRRLLWTAVACATLGMSCSGSTNPVAEDSVDHDAIMRAVYFDQRTPEGFHQESFDDENYHVIYHISSQDIVAPSLRTTSRGYELCSNSTDVVTGWSETAAAYRAVYRAFQAVNETEEYYEVIRVNDNDSNVIEHARVFKCSFVNRATLDTAAGDAGNLGTLPVQPGRLEFLAQYLWLFSVYNNYGHAIISTSLSGNSNDAEYVMLQATLERGKNDCDTIYLDNLTYKAGLNDGALRFKQHSGGSFRSRFDNGTYSKCADD